MPLPFLVALVSEASVGAAMRAYERACASVANTPVFAYSRQKGPSGNRNYPAWQRLVNAIASRGWSPTGYIEVTVRGYVSWARRQRRTTVVPYVTQLWNTVAVARYEKMLRSSGAGAAGGPATSIDHARFEVEDGAQMFRALRQRAGTTTDIELLQACWRAMPPSYLASREDFWSLPAFMFDDSDDHRARAQAVRDRMAVDPELRRAIMDSARSAL